MSQENTNNQNTAALREQLDKAVQTRVGQTLPNMERLSIVSVKALLLIAEELEYLNNHLEDIAFQLAKERKII